MTRDDVLRDLIAYRRPIETLRRDLTAFPWDSPELVTLRADDVARVLGRYLDGELSAGEVADWADAVEVRDDIAIEAMPPALRDAVFALATPTLEGLLTRDSATAWRERLA